MKSGCDVLRPQTRHAGWQVTTLGNSSGHRKGPSFTQTAPGEPGAQTFAIVGEEPPVLSLRPARRRYVGDVLRCLPDLMESDVTRAIYLPLRGHNPRIGCLRPSSPFWYLWRRCWSPLTNCPVATLLSVSLRFRPEQVSHKPVSQTED